MTLARIDWLESRPPRAVLRRDSGNWGLQAALERRGLGPVAGVDEAGRGACAGPLVIASCVLRPGDAARFEGLTDSKLLTAAARDRMFDLVVARAVDHAVVVVPVEEVDLIGVHVSNIEGMRRAIARLRTHPGYVLIDGFRVPGLTAPSMPVIKGDQAVACVAAASVLAKVTRDRIMAELHGDLPDVRVRRAQGLLHRSARRGPRPARAQRRTPVVVRQRGHGGAGARAPPTTSGGLECGGGRRGSEWGIRPRRSRGARDRMSAEDLEKYETEMELQLYREYRDIVGQFSYVVETERRFYLANGVDVQVRDSDGEVYFEVRMSDAWVWDMYRPARFVKNVRVITFKDVNVEELDKPDLRLPEEGPFGT